MQFLSDLAAILGSEAELSEANWQDALRQRLAEGEQQLAETRQQLSMADERAETLTAQLAQPIEPPLPAVDAQVLEELAESAELKLSRLVERACITPAVRDRLEALLVGQADQRPAVLLSRTAAQAAGMSQPLARQALEALALNDVVQLGEQTRRQTIALGRHVPGDEPRVDPQTQQRMASAAYGARPATPAQQK